MRILISGMVVLLIMSFGSRMVRADTTWVDIQRYDFIPMHENGPVGTTLTWINFDSLPHTVTSDIGLFTSGVLAPSQSFSYSFGDTGVFYYHDSLTQDMGAHIHVHYPSELNTALVVVPVGDPITLPANGGTFSYNVTGTNQTNAPLTYQYWTKIYPPNNAPPFVALIPKSIMFPANSSRGALMNQYIPSTAEPGVYRYVECLGIYTTTIRAWGHFYFTKSGAGDGTDGWEAGIISDWTNYSPTGTGAALVTSHHPEPFNPSTQIIYTLPAAGFVQLNVYNLRGARVATLINGQVPTGQHQVQFDAGNLPTGLYIYRLTAAGQTVSGKMMLIK
jgi:plastocyanin